MAKDTLLDYATSLYGGTPVDTGWVVGTTATDEVRTLTFPGPPPKILVATRDSTTKEITGYTLDGAPWEMPWFMWLRSRLPSRKMTLAAVGVFLFGIIGGLAWIMGWIGLPTLPTASSISAWLSPPTGQPAATTQQAQLAAANAALQAANAQLLAAAQAQNTAATSPPAASVVIPPAPVAANPAATASAAPPLSATVPTPGPVDPTVKARQDMQDALVLQLRQVEPVRDAAKAAEANAEHQVVMMEQAKTTLSAINAWGEPNEAALSQSRAALVTAKALATAAQRQVDIVNSQILLLPSGGSDLLVVYTLEQTSKAQREESAAQIEILRQQLVELGRKVDSNKDAMVASVNKAAKQAKTDAAAQLREQQATTAAIKALETKVGELAHLFVDVGQIRVSVEKIDKVNASLDTLIKYAEAHKGVPADLKKVEGHLQNLREALKREEPTSAPAQSIAPTPLYCYPQYNGHRFIRGKCSSR